MIGEISQISVSKMFTKFRQEWKSNRGVISGVLRIIYLISFIIWGGRDCTLWGHLITINKKQQQEDFKC